MTGLIGSGNGSSSLGGSGGGSDRTEGFNGSGCFPIDSGGVALGKMTGGLVACLVTGSSWKDTSAGPGEEG